jgi:hypothetical protein
MATDGETTRGVVSHLVWGGARGTVPRTLVHVALYILFPNVEQFDSISHWPPQRSCIIFLVIPHIMLDERPHEGTSPDTLIRSLMNNPSDLS